MIRKAAYCAFSQLVNSVSPHSSKEGESILCSVFDELLQPLYTKIIQNPVNEEHSPELIPYVLELFGNAYRFVTKLVTNSVYSEHFVHELHTTRDKFIFRREFVERE